METNQFRQGNRVNGGIIIAIDGTYITCAGAYNMSGMTSFESGKIIPELFDEKKLVEWGLKDNGDNTFGDENFCIEKRNNGFWLKGYTGTQKRIDYTHQLQNLYQSLNGNELIK